MRLLKGTQCKNRVLFQSFIFLLFGRLLLTGSSRPLQLSAFLARKKNQLMTGMFLCVYTNGQRKFVAFLVFFFFRFSEVWKDMRKYFRVVFFWDLNRLPFLCYFEGKWDCTRVIYFLILSSSNNTQNRTLVFGKHWFLSIKFNGEDVLKLWNFPVIALFQWRNTEIE